MGKKMGEERQPKEAVWVWSVGNRKRESTEGIEWAEAWLRGNSESRRLERDWLVYEATGERLMRWLGVTLTALLVSSFWVSGLGAQQVTFHRVGDRVEVQVADQPFTTVHTAGWTKPILYPVFAPGQVAMTRSWPMDERPGEPHDHPHHKSVWFAHGDVNGADFWYDKATIEVIRMSIDEGRSECVLETRWRKADEELATDRSVLRFGFDERSRWLDWDLTVTAGDKPVVLGDTKEGTFAVRTHPDLQLTPNPADNVPEVFGHALNSEGARDKGIWGKRSRWVHYFGPVDGAQVGLMLMDHPSNLRHPTTWHARDYGLVAANPFGLHDFLGEPAGAGDVTLQPGESLRLVYRLLVHAGDATDEDRREWYQAFAERE